MAQRRSKLLAGTIALVLMALSTLGVSVTAHALSDAPGSTPAHVTDRDTKVCIKFRAHVPSPKKCHRTTGTFSATRRSSSDDMQATVLPVTAGPAYPLGGYVRRSVAILGALHRSVSHRRRAPFWSVFALTQQLRN